MLCYHLYIFLGLAGLYFEGVYPYRHIVFLSCTPLIWIYIKFYWSHKVTLGVVSNSAEEFDVI